MGLATVRGSGVRQEDSSVIVTQNRYKKELAEMSSLPALTRQLWMHGAQQGKRLQEAAKVFHPTTWHLLIPNSKFHCWKGNPMLEGVEV